MDLNFGALNVTVRGFAASRQEGAIHNVHEVMTLSVIVVLSMVVDGQSGSLFVLCRDAKAVGRNILHSGPTGCKATCSAQPTPS